MTTERTISFEVREHIGVIAEYSSGWSKELNIIAWNGAAPKYDIRDWDENHQHMSKGITLFEGEMKTLVDVYIQAKNRRVFEQAKKDREIRAREMEESRRAYEQRRAAQDKAIAARNANAEYEGQADEEFAEDTAPMDETPVNSEPSVAAPIEAEAAEDFDEAEEAV